MPLARLESRRLQVHLPGIRLNPLSRQSRRNVSDALITHKCQAASGRWPPAKTPGFRCFLLFRESIIPTTVRPSFRAFQLINTRHRRCSLTLADARFVSVKRRDTREAQRERERVVSTRGETREEEADRCARGARKII